jgi:hypothetical protein
MRSGSTIALAASGPWNTRCVAFFYKVAGCRIEDARHEALRVAIVEREPAALHLDRSQRLSTYAQDQTLVSVRACTDDCVAWSATDARKLGFAAVVIEDACRCIDLNGSLAKAWADMTKAGVTRLQSSDLLPAG